MAIGGYFAFLILVMETILAARDFTVEGE